MPIFTFSSLIAVLSGAVTAGLYRVSPVVIALNLAAWLVGWGASQLRPQKSAAPWIAALTCAALAATLVSPGMEGVHRWITLGLSINVAELLLPLTLVALTFLHAPLRLIVPLLIVILLTAQPDASQAAAFAAAAAVIVASAECSLGARATTVLGLLAAAVFAALRPDPLLPVPEVEGIVALAAQSSLAIAALAVLALAGVAVSLAQQVVRTPNQTGALSLTIYFVVSALAPLAGAFPVPLVGMGISPIIGLWLGVGWLRMRRRF